MLKSKQKHIYLAQLSKEKKAALFVGMRKTKAGRDKLDAMTEVNCLFASMMDGASFILTEQEYRGFTDDQ